MLRRCLSYRQCFLQRGLRTLGGLDESAYEVNGESKPQHGLHKHANRLGKGKENNRVREVSETDTHQGRNLHEPGQQPCNEATHRHKPGPQTWLRAVSVAEGRETVTNLEIDPNGKHFTKLPNTLALKLGLVRSNLSIKQVNEAGASGDNETEQTAVTSRAATNTK